MSHSAFVNAGLMC